VSCVRRKSLEASPQDRVGLKKDILAIPLNRGFFLCANDLVILSDTLDVLSKMDGTHKLENLISEPDIELALEQLNYYGLVSFSSSEGKLRVAEVQSEYWKYYTQGDFVIFSMVPLTVELYITNNCNFNCIHCIKDSKSRSNRVRNKSELSTADLLKIIDECGRLGVANLQFMGGEPLAHPDFFKLLSHAKERGVLYVRTSTNGWLIDDKVAKELSKYFDNIQISVHGASSYTHDHIVRRQGAWEQARRATQILKENNVKVNISFTVMRENANDIEKMSSMAEEWGAHSLRFLRLINQGRGCSLSSWTDKEVIEIGDGIRQMHEKLGSRLELDAGGFPPLRKIRNDASFYGCDAGKTLMCIESNGGVRACGGLCGDYLGQIKGASILDVWHSPLFIGMRKQSDCQDCNYREICWGSCQVT
jgi:radical SAM protein with 4Fe4S-binding SPASM domain